MENNWIPITKQLPKQGQVVETKIDDTDGIRNVQKLKLSGKLWFHADGAMYVYYTPTHWRELN